MTANLQGSGLRTWRFYAQGPFGQVHVHASQGGIAHQRPLICFHGTPYSGVEFALLQEQLAQDRLVLCPDTPGFGGSDRPAAMAELGEYAAALFAALHTSGLLDAHPAVDLLGHHTGAAIASELAVTQGAAVAKVVLSGVPLFSAAQRADMMARYLKPSPIFSDPDFVPGEFRNTVLSESAMAPERRLALFVERLRAGTDPWWAGRAVFAYDLEATLRRLSQPALFLLLRDPLTPNSRAAQALAPRAECAELEASTTDDALDVQATTLAAVVRDFLDR